MQVPYFYPSASCFRAKIFQLRSWLDDSALRDPPSTLGCGSAALRLPRPLTFALLLLALSGLGCGTIRVETRPILATAYCSCGECNSYTRGHWYFLKLDFWSRTVCAGSDKGRPYTGRTASGGRLHPYHPGLLSEDTFLHPWYLPFRLVLPWLWLPQDGTLAADTRYYPFGTRMYIPDYGWGRVEDRGGAIKGPDHIDLFMPSHHQTIIWGRQRVTVEILREE